MLKTETNTPAMETSILAAFHYAADRGAHEGEAHFEHGQWWITCNCGAAWSVVDCEHSDPIKRRTMGGFGFERVSDGEDEDYHRDE